MFLINTLQNWFGKRSNPGQWRNVQPTSVAPGQAGAAGAKRLSPLRPLVETACKEQGLVKAEAATWISAVIELGIVDNLNTEVIIEKVRTTGRILTEEEKRSLGIFDRDSYGAQYVSALSGDGLTAPGHASGYLVREVLDLRLSAWHQQQPSQATMA